METKKNSLGLNSIYFGLMLGVALIIFDLVLCDILLKFGMPVIRCIKL